MFPKRLRLEELSDLGSQSCELGRELKVLSDSLGDRSQIGSLQTSTSSQRDRAATLPDSSSGVFIPWSLVLRCDAPPATSRREGVESSSMARFARRLWPQSTFW